MIVAEITSKDFPEATRFVGRCTEPGCSELPHAMFDTRPGAIAWLRGWFKQHVMDTGHRIVIEEDER